MNDPVLVTLCQKLVARVLMCYNEDYIKRCAESDPDSLLGLTKQLENYLSPTVAEGELKP